VEKKDTLITFLEISFLRLKMEEQARNGTSTEPQELSNLEKRINLLISRAPERVMSSNTTQLTQDGGRSGSTPELTERAEVVKLLTLVMEKLSLSRVLKTRKLNQLLYRLIQEDHTNNGRSTTLTK
jgi:hypothetical protein